MATKSNPTDYDPLCESCFFKGGSCGRDHSDLHPEWVEKPKPRLNINVNVASNYGTPAPPDSATQRDLIDRARGRVADYSDCATSYDPRIASLVLRQLMDTLHYMGALPQGVRVEVSQLRHGGSEVKYSQNSIPVTIRVGD